MVKSAARVFELLELFDAARRPLRVTEIAEHLRVPQSSVSMLLKTLVLRGYMEFDASRREYCPSVRVAFIGDWVTRLPDHKEGAPDVMRRISNITGESVLLGRQNGVLMQYLSVLESEHALRFSPAPGTLRPMHRTAIGIMLMSQLDDAQIGLLLRRYNAEAGKQWPIAQISETFRAIASARENGYYESANLATSGAGVIATLLPTPIRGQRLGIGIGGPVDRLHKRRKELLSVLLKVANAQNSPIA